MVNVQNAERKTSCQCVKMFKNKLVSKYYGSNSECQTMRNRIMCSTDTNTTFLKYLPFGLAEIKKDEHATVN